MLYANCYMLFAICYSPTQKVSPTPLKHHNTSSFASFIVQMVANESSWSR